jgi:hypothetical protein
MYYSHCLILCGTLLVAAASEAVGIPPLDEKDADALAALIDRHIDDRLAAEKVAPAAGADDAEFLRRVYLDLTGRIPSVATVHAFLADQTSNKRQRLINELLNGEAYSRHFTNVWRAALLADTPAGAQNVQVRTGFENWLRQQLKENIAYDQMARAILAPSGTRAFYVANEEKPENLAAATARVFLGVKLECAQCHRHPFAPWTREQFWSLAAFYPASRERNRNRQTATSTNFPRQIKIPGTDKVVKAKFLDDTEPASADGADSRLLLAQWVVSADNPWFARAAVNRVWAHFFGTGLVDPVDEIEEHNPPSHPELLEELTKQFIAHRFDLKYLIRAITQSQAYQRTSLLSHPGQEDSRLFARMALKSLSPEQIYESVQQATGFSDRDGPSSRRRIRPEFMAKFSGAQRPETPLSILQALALMNGKLTADVTDLERSQTLAAVIDAPFFDTAERIETLYLAALTRLPRPDERERLVKYVTDNTEEGRRRALADVFWALLNSGEFILNH